MCGGVDNLGKRRANCGAIAVITSMTYMTTLQKQRSEPHSKTGVKVLPQGALQMWE